MVSQLRHRQTKGAATVATGLPPPRHISTLHGDWASFAAASVTYTWFCCAVSDYTTI